MSISHLSCTYMTYTSLNENILVEKIETQKLVVAGQDEDPNATIHGTVVLWSDDEKGIKTTPDLTGNEVVFVRGHARKIKLEGKEYFIVKKENILLWRNA